MLLTQHTHLEGAAVLSLLQVWKLRWWRGAGGEIKVGQMLRHPAAPHTHEYMSPSAPLRGSQCGCFNCDRKEKSVRAHFLFLLSEVGPLPKSVACPSVYYSPRWWRTQPSVVGCSCPRGPGRYLGMSLWGCSWHRVGVGDRNAVQCPALPRTGPYRMTRPHFHSAEGERPCVSYLEKN